MILESRYINGRVHLSESFEIETEVNREEETFVSVNFFNTEDGKRLNDHPENNRWFTWEGIETLTDAEIMETLFNLVPELKR